MNTRNNTSYGYTLIELLLYVSIAGTLLVSLSVFFGQSVEARIKNQTITEVNQQGAAIIDLIQQSTRNATGIIAPAVATTAASLTLTMPTPGISPTVFNLNGTTMQIKEGGGAAIPISNSRVRITNLTFTNIGRSGTDGAVRVSFTIERINTAGRNEYSYSETFTTTVAIR